MEERGMSGGPAGPLRPRRLMPGGLAVGTSVLFHTALIALLPSFMLGKSFDRPQWPRLPPLDLRDIAYEKIVAAPAEAVETRLRADNPEKVSDLLGRPEVATAAVAFPREVPDPPDFVAGPLRGAGAAVADPTPEAPPRPWEPRQQIVSIQDRVFADEVSALPRRLLEKVERVPQAPDITLPAMPEETLAIRIPGGGGGDLASLSVPRGVPRTVGPAAPGSGRTGPVTPPAPRADALAPGESAGLTEKPSEITALRPAESFLALETRVFEAPDEPGVRYFEIRLVRKNESLLPVLPKDVLFIQDCSASITPWKLQHCKAGLRLGLEKLRPGDRFNLIRFDAKPTRCFPDWQPVTAASREQALAFIDAMRSVGDTDVFASLQAARALSAAPDRPLLAVLLTDGRPTAGVTDTAEIIERFSRENLGRICTYTHTGGWRVNRFLVDMLAFRNRGDSRWVTTEEDIPTAVQTLSQQISRPVLWDLGYQFSGIAGDEIFPRTLENMYLDMPLTLVGRIQGKPPQAAVQIVGRSGVERRDVVFPLDWAGAAPGDAEIRRRWATHRIYELLSQHISDAQPGALAEVRSLAQRYNIPMPYGTDSSRPK